MGVGGAGGTMREGNHPSKIAHRNSDSSDDGERNRLSIVQTYSMEQYVAKPVKPQQPVSLTKFTSVAQFLLNVPPYTVLDASGKECEGAREALLRGTTFDGYCPHCGKAATISLMPTVTGYSYNELYDKAVNEGSLVIRRIDAKCTRDPTHFFFFFVTMSNFQLQKVGQLPSLADIAIDESKKYRSVLSPEDSRELHKAIGLAAHEVGIGSFVYLRRIFERLIWKRFNSAKTANGWSDADFQKLRMDERVQFLKDHLPEFLVENSTIYGLLSKGLHELTEEECLDMFPVLRGSIVEILEQDQERKKAKERQEEMKKTIHKYSSKIGNGDSGAGD